MLCKPSLYNYNQLEKQTNHINKDNLPNLYLKTNNTREW